MRSKLSLAISIVVLLAAPSAIAGGNPNGVMCAASADCDSGFCVDGVCCNAACAGQCEACDVAGIVGTCTPVVGASHGARTKCSDGAGDACLALACDGVDRVKCAAYANGLETTCAAATCSSGTFTSARVCDGKGSCSSGGSMSCGAYACGTTNRCNTTCVSNVDCSTGYVCASGGHCVPPTAQCSSDGLTSISPSGGMQSCTPYRCSGAGTCFSVCASDADCAPMHACNTTSFTCYSTVPPSGYVETGSTHSCALDRVGARTRSAAAIASLSVLALAIAARRRRAR
jgi:hypothetical protein